MPHLPTAKQVKPFLGTTPSYLESLKFDNALQSARKCSSRLKMKRKTAISNTRSYFTTEVVSDKLEKKLQNIDFRGIPMHCYIIIKI